MDPSNWDVPRSLKSHSRAMHVIYIRPFHQAGEQYASAAQQIALTWNQLHVQQAAQTSAVHTAAVIAQAQRTGAADLTKLKKQVRTRAPPSMNNHVGERGHMELDYAAVPSGV